MTGETLPLIWLLKSNKTDRSQVVSGEKTSHCSLFSPFAQVPAAARAGAIAPCEVTVPAQNTGLGPEKTSFFQALGITTKISRGTIEILSDVQLIKTGDKVGSSETMLLNMLNISPFSFGLVIQQVFDNGSIYNPEVLDITEETLHSRFLEVPEGPFQALPFS